MQQGISSQLSRVAEWTWVRDLRQAPASRLHARRRRAAQVELERLKPRSILFVCHGNICRSPFAACSILALVRARDRERNKRHIGRVHRARALLSLQARLLRHRDLASTSRLIAPH